MAERAFLPSRYDIDIDIKSKNCVEMELTLVGLGNSGKTTLVNVLSSGSFVEDMVIFDSI